MTSSEHFDNFKNANIILYGPKLCGKTTFIDNIIAKKSPLVWVVKDIGFLEYLHDRQLEDRRENKKVENIYIVLDISDNDEDMKLLESGIVKKLLAYGRFINVTTVISITDIVHINTYIRANIDYIIMFDSSKKEELFEKLIKKFWICIDNQLLDESTFIYHYLMNTCMDPYRCFVIDPIAKKVGWSKYNRLDLEGCKNPELEKIVKKQKVN